MTSTPLSDRQLEIVMHLCNGLTQDEIATQMSFSKSNVNQQISAARRKVGAKTTVHLASIVIAAGVLYWTPEGMTTENPARNSQIDCECGGSFLVLAGVGRVCGECRRPAPPLTI